jgi:hypothetical protein
MKLPGFLIPFSNVNRKEGIRNLLKAFHIFLVLQVNGQGKMDGVDLVSVEQQHEEASY